MRYVQVEPRMTWPIDDARIPGSDGIGTEWFQRHGSAEAVFGQRMSVASIIAAYHALILQPQRERNKIAGVLKRALLRRKGA